MTTTATRRPRRQHADWIDGHDRLHVAEQYAGRPRDGLIVAVEQRTTRAGRAVLLTPVQAGELHGWLGRWLGAAALSPADLDSVLSALADAATYRQGRGEVDCADCRREFGGSCYQHTADLDSADDYRALAARLAPGSGDGA